MGSESKDLPVGPGSSDRGLRTRGPPSSSSPPGIASSLPAIRLCRLGTPSSRPGVEPCPPGVNRCQPGIKPSVAAISSSWPGIQPSRPPGNGVRRCGRPAATAAGELNAAGNPVAVGVAEGISRASCATWPQDTSGTWLVATRENLPSSGTASAGRQSRIVAAPEPMPPGSSAGPLQPSVPEPGSAIPASSSSRPCHLWARADWSTKWSSRPRSDPTRGTGPRCIPEPCVPLPLAAARA